MRPEVVYGQEIQPILMAWLESMGLAFDPFVVLDAGEDPDIPAYLVGHADFEQLWGDWHSFVFAPAGGGKTAFRARLARACRVGEDGRRVFPVVYHRLPEPSEVDDATHGQAIHLSNILRQAAQELLFLMAYRPLELNLLDAETLATLRRILEVNLPSPLNDYLSRLRYFGNLSPLAQEFDRTASYLINPPGQKDLDKFCVKMENIPALPSSARSLDQQFDELIGFLQGPLHFEAVYLLVDGADAYQETIHDPRAAKSLIQVLLDKMAEWTARNVFAKFFLPAELEPIIKQWMPSHLTSYVKTTIIKWSADDLIQVIQRRLSVATRGLFDSLDMMSNPGLRGAEETLARMASPVVPREVLLLTDRMFVEHIRRSGEQGKLELGDLDMACNWYAEQHNVRPT